MHKSILYDAYFIDKSSISNFAMVKPKFTIKVGNASFLAGKPNSRAEAKVQRKKINVKEILIQQAVLQSSIASFIMLLVQRAYKRGYAALQAGMFFGFSLIKDRSTIDCRFINYGFDGTNSGLPYVSRGEPCKKMVKEGRESVRVYPVVSLGGNINDIVCTNNFNYPVTSICLKINSPSKPYLSSL